MSRKESRVGGDPTESTGHARELDNQKSEGMSVSLTSEAGTSVGVQSTSDHQAPISGQERECVKGGVSSRTRKQSMTQSLTGGHHRLVQKPRKAMTRKSLDVKAFGSGGTKPGSVPGAGRGRGSVCPLLETTLKPESVRLPDNSSEYLVTEEESEEGMLPPSHSPKDSKSDQFALSPVTPPQGLSTPGGITTTVTYNPVLAQDPSPVLDSARPSSSTPVKQEGTAAQPLEVSVEVHVLPDSEQDAADVSEAPVGALSRMSLGTQVGSELSHPRDLPQSPLRNTGGDIGQHLNLDPAKPVAKLVGQMRAQLSPTPGFASGGIRVPPLSNNDVVVVGQRIDRVGLENLPLVQPKQVTCLGFRGLFQALQGTKIHLFQSEDDESTTSDMETSNSSLLLDCSEADPLALNHGGPEREEGELTGHSFSPDAMDQEDVLGHDTYLDGGLASDTGAAPGRISGFRSEEMDTTAQPLEVESYSDRPMESQDARYARSGPDYDWGERESETARHRQLYPKIQPYVIPTPSGIDNGWYQEEDLMDPREVALPARSVGRPNVNGSIGGDKGSYLPPKRPGRQYYHNNRELSRRVTYPRSEKDEKGRYPHITEQECLASTERQDTACRGDAYWKDQLAQYNYLPTPEHSLVNFSYRVKMATYVVP